VRSKPHLFRLFSIQNSASGEVSPML